MKQTNISIFIPHIGCPHKCSFCDQKCISGEVKAPDAAEVTALLDSQAEHLRERAICAEIAFFGGSFTAVPRGYMISLLEAAEGCIKKYPDVYVGIRCSTRPDCISEEIISVLKKYCVTAVELGAQSMSDEVLSANDRGHSAQDVHSASELIKKAGISLGLQMMTGLYRDSDDAVMHTMREFIAISPDTVRIYPTVILKGTRLGELYESGEYESFSFEHTVELCAVLLREFEAAGISVIRMGLHASTDVEHNMLGGVYHPSFREICESRLFLQEMEQRLSTLPKGDYVILTDKRNISKATGQKRCNIQRLCELGYCVKIKEHSCEGFEIVPADK